MTKKFGFPRKSVFLAGLLVVLTFLAPCSPTFAKEDSSWIDEGLKTAGKVKDVGKYLTKIANSVEVQDAIKKSEKLSKFNNPAGLKWLEGKLQVAANVIDAGNLAKASYDCVVSDSFPEFSENFDDLIYKTVNIAIKRSGGIAGGIAAGVICAAFPGIGLVAALPMKAMFEIVFSLVVKTYVSPYASREIVDFLRSQEEYGMLKEKLFSCRDRIAEEFADFQSEDEPPEPLPGQNTIIDPNLRIEGRTIYSPDPPTEGGIPGLE